MLQKKLREEQGALCRFTCCVVCDGLSLSLSLSLEFLMLQKELWYKRKAPVFGARHCALKRMKKVPAKKKKKVEREKGKTRYMEKALRSVFLLYFLTETQQRLTGEKKKRRCETAYLRGLFS